MKLYCYDITLQLTVHIAGWSEAQALEIAKRAVLTAQQHVSHKNTIRAVTDAIAYAGKAPQLVDANIPTPLPSAFTLRADNDA